MDLSAEANYALSWVQDIDPDSQKNFIQSIKELDSLPVSNDLHRMFWRQLIEIVESNPSWKLRLDGLAKYCQVTRSPQSLLVLFDRDPESLPLLMRALSISPRITHYLVSDPEAFELLRITKGQPLDVNGLQGDLAGECQRVVDDSHLKQIILRFKSRETVRIAFGQWFGNVSIPETYRQLTILETLIVRNTSAFVFRKVSDRLGIPMLPSGNPSRYMIFAFDGLGGQCQGYDRLLRLMILAETAGRTSSNRIVSNLDFYERFAMDWTELMMSSTGSPSNLISDDHSNESIYQLSPPVQPHQRSASWIVDLDMAFQHYDLTGRTWERELFVGARFVGGDEQSADRFLSRLRPWIYRRYVGDADIAGLGAMQRKLRRRLEAQSSHRSEAIDESRAIGDLEQTIRFLQLLHGHELPKLRVANYFDAIDMLHHEKILMKSEHEVIKEAYEGLLKTKSIHELDADNFLGPSQNSRTRQQLAESIELSRMVVKQLLEAEFPAATKTADETDLILDPQPNPGWVTSVLERHGFHEATTAYGRLMEMARENGHILSTRKCRYYLSNIAPQFLASIAKTPDPDWTLMNMERVTNVLGGKGILWELLSASPAIMHLVVRLCGSSEYLVNLLTQSPGMIDDLLNSLLLDRLPLKEEMEHMLEELCQQAADIDSVIRDFKSAMHLQVGVRDLMAKESIVDTHVALAVIAEACLCQIIQAEYLEMVRKYGNPTTESGTPNTTQSSRDVSPKLAQYVVLALGRLGGNDPNYHSDFTLVFLFDHDGTTQHEHAGRVSPVTSNRHFFEEWVQRVMKRVNRPTPKGRLFEVDFRFGPLGEKGLLAMRLDQFITSFELPAANIIHRYSLLKSRPIFGSEKLKSQAVAAINDVIKCQGFTAEERRDLKQFRVDQEQSASVHNVKRGIGGSIDIEFAVQWIQMEKAREQPSILTPNTPCAIDRLQSFGFIDESIAACLRRGYDYLRGVQSAIRLMKTDSRHDLPTSKVEIEKLAYLVGAVDGEALLTECDSIRARNREILNTTCQ